MSQPTLTREGIAVALFALIQALPGLATPPSRRLMFWGDVPPENQPTAFLAEGNHASTNDPNGLPDIWRFSYKVYLYAYSADLTVAPASLLNPLLDALEAALKPVQFGPPGFPGSMQVLGDTTGRIRHVWISGPIETDEGALGPQAIAIVPIEVEFV